MLRWNFYLFLIFTLNISWTTGDTGLIIREIVEKRDLEILLVDMLNRLGDEHDVSCLVFLCDPVYLNVFEGGLFKRTLPMPFIMIVVEEYEDLLSPNYLTVEALRQARKDGCNVYITFLANGQQMARLLRFGDRHRVLDTRAKYIILHDYRLFHSDLHYIWKRIVNVVFLRHHRKISGVKKSNSWFDLSSVPFPNPIRTVLVPKRLDIWNDGRFHYNRLLFKDKTTDLRGEVLNVVYLDHAPSVVAMKSNSTNKIGGVEIEILNTLAEKMNFEPKLYEPINAELQQWGQKQSNGSFSGLLGEMVNGRADVVLGNLQYTPYHLELTDLTIPYISQCFTFLTPEALTDNSWKTLILPFNLNMWIAVLLVLLITGAIFYGLANYYMNLLNYQKREESAARTGLALKDYDDVIEQKPVGLYLFGEMVNSVLYTYGMLLVISLPKLPTGWSIRLLTGWYWLYCILLVVSYRASMTAILANPTPRVTIDTLKELVDSKMTCGGWGMETKRFFEESIDEMTRKIGAKFEITNDPDVAVKKVAQGIYAYYENVYYLEYLSVKRYFNDLMMQEYDNSTVNGTEELTDYGEERSLHIMASCIVNIPVSLGLQKNSPLKPLVDKYIRRIFEVGLVEKWLNDAMYPIRVSRIGAEDEVKALMNLKKLYGAFIAIAIGYALSAICLIGELCYWHLVVKRDPKFDKYALDMYYSSKKNKKQ